MRRRLQTLAAAMLLLILGFLVWASLPAAPMPAAEAALVSDRQILVDDSEWLQFHPATGQPTTGLIFYPGGRVEPQAYAPAARGIAEAGYLVVIVPMPLNLAVFASERAGEVMGRFPEIERWVVGGHSLGGTMAARFARRHSESIQGLLLWAAYPASGDDLSTSGLPVTSIYGTLDGLTSSEDIVRSRGLLPAATEWVAVVGGNHAQFGWYGDQSGDQPAAISREAQQAQVLAATLALMDEVADGP